MKRLSALIGAVAASLVGPATAEFEGEVQAGYATQYIFRGQDYGNSLFYGGFDGTYSSLFGMKKLSANAGVWAGTFDFSPAGGPDIDSEIDLYGSLGYNLGENARFDVGYTYYLFPDEGDFDSQEAFFSLSAYSESLETHFALTYHLDIADQDNGGYLEGTAARRFALNDKLSLDVELLAAFLLEEGEFSHLGATFAMPYQLTDLITVSPYLSATLELDGLEGVSPVDAENEYIGGVTISAGF